MKKVIKILWVDDMDNWVNIVSKNLDIIAEKRNINFNILHVKNGEEENLHLKLMQYDCDGIVMDYMMDPFNGDKYVHMIRNGDDYEHLATVPIIFYSQATDIDLASLVNDLSNVHTVFRGNLEEKIIEMFFK